MKFIPDRSVTTAKDDRLNRAPFAFRLADTIRDWKRDESIVIGLYGAWGSGKTSVLHFAVERLQDATIDWPLEQKPIVIWFNPWNFSEQEKLLQAFFQQVYAAINKVDAKAGKDLKKSIKTFAQVLGVMEPIPMVGGFLSAGGKFVELFASEKSIEDTKEEVAKIFKKLNRRILILIDDVDRLTRDEIRLLFQLIKVNADFPNTIYLVAFAREVVENALTNEQGVSGREYLEKIVQVGFNIPKVDEAFLQGYFIEEMNSILKDVVTEKWDQDHWAKIYVGGFRPFIQTLRDVKRFVNSLGMTLQMMKSEVDVIDFIGLESLRVFLPEIYQGISESKNLFTNPQQALSGSERLLPEIKKSVEDIFEKAYDQRDIARKICTALFPALDSLYRNTLYDNSYWALWRQQKRICHQDNFDAYFLLGTPKGAVSHLEVDEFLEKSNDETVLSEELMKYYLGNRYRRLLERLDDRIDSLAEDQIKILCQVLLKFGDTMPDTKEDLLDFGSDRLLTTIIRALMFKLPVETRFSWYQALLENNPPLYTTIKQVLFDQPEKGNVREANLFTEEQLEQLKAICVKNIDRHSEQEFFINQKEFKFIMSRWKDWSPASSARVSFLEKIQSKAESFLDFASKFILETRSQTLGSYVTETDQEFDAKGFFDFYDLEETQKIINTLTKEDLMTLSPEQLLALKGLSDAISKITENLLPNDPNN